MKSLGFAEIRKNHYNSKVLEMNLINKKAVCVEIINKSELRKQRAIEILKNKTNICSFVAEIKKIIMTEDYCSKDFEKLG